MCTAPNFPKGKFWRLTSGPKVLTASAIAHKKLTNLDTVPRAGANIQILIPSGISGADGWQCAQSGAPGTRCLCGVLALPILLVRSEERRVGKEWTWRRERDGRAGQT